jgi:hypothetical protein
MRVIGSEKPNFLRIVAGSILCAGMSFAATAPEPTFSRDVAPILYRHCVSCHHSGDIAPMSLVTYQEVRPWAAAIREAVALRRMPPWLADPKVGHWSNDPRLSEREISTLEAWTERGKLEGNPRDLPQPPAFHDGWKIGTPDVVIAIPEHKLAAPGPDEYAYINVPTNFTEDRWVVAAELRPGNRKVVHHAHVFVVDEAANKASAEASTKDPAKEYANSIRVKEGTLEWVRPEAPVINDGCAVDDNARFPGSKVSDLGGLIASYLPGREADVYAPGTARKIPAGASVNFQIHYSHTTGKAETDITSVGLIFAKEPPKQVSRRVDLANHMFMIPAGDPDHQVTECHTFDKPIAITSLTPHMHLRGKAMRMIARYPTGEEQTLLLVPAYNFNWQFTYRAQPPINLPKGTRIQIIAEFDNSVNNPLNPNSKEPVRWGSASENEMMDGWIEYVDAEPANPPH